MNNTRRILEGKNLKKRYSLANFYCNWFIHTELRDSPSVYKSLYEISRMMHQAFESEPGAGRTKLDEVAVATVSMMTMRELRQQLKKLYEEVGVNPMMCYSKPAWDWFAIHLVLQLADKILAFPYAVLNQEATAKKRYKSAWQYYQKILRVKGTVTFLLLFFLPVFDSQVFLPTGRVS